MLMPWSPLRYAGRETDEAVPEKKLGNSGDEELDGVDGFEDFPARFLGAAAEASLEILGRPDRCCAVLKSIHRP